MEHAESWRNRPLQGEHPYVYLDGIWLKRSWGGEVENVSVLVAIGVDETGYRKILGVSEGAKEDRESWLNFLRHLKERGLKGVRLFISDKCLGLVEALGGVYPESKWQRCVVHFYRNVFTVTPSGKKRVEANMLKAIHASENLEAARKNAKGSTVNLLRSKLNKPADTIVCVYGETFGYCVNSPECRRSIKTDKPPGRIDYKIT